ncbi:substrate-binding domain-containing protein [Clostridium sp. HBUAS56010]|uniref:sugar ABC transporter substrate-binding protein n=1 Tax=Clostridium sp. HBUAS56010 TaxID=2571127 RepID=UPI001177CA9C|nr:substrate-binding domain-containing protein [Clostridium sp. HBUAS56010]
MTRREKGIWSFLAAALILLYLLSSTDFIIKEKKTDIYPISVVLSETSDEYFASFKKGAEKAAEEYNVDVSFISLFEKGDAKKQIELVKREINDGASAVVVIPVKPQECARLLDETVLNSPVMVMGNMFSDERTGGGVFIDYEEEGEKLGHAIAKENSSSIPVAVLTEGLEYGYNKEVYAGLQLVLNKAGFSLTLLEKNEDEIQGSIKENAGKGKTILAAIDVGSLNGSAGFISDNPPYERNIKGIYGVGSTTRILRELDNGIIKGLVVINQYDAGYSSVEKAVEAIHKKQGQEQIVLESYYIKKESLRKGSFEKMLYPVD